MAILDKESFCPRVSRGQVRRLIAAFWAVNAFLLLSNLALAAGWTPPVNTIGVQLNMDNESCIASWYPSALLFLLGLTATALAGMVDAAARRAWITRLAWWGLAGIAFFLSADEVSVLHETIGSSFEKYVSDTLFGMKVAWATVMAPFILAAVALMAGLFWRVVGRVPRARRLAFAGIACWVSAVVLETFDYLVVLQVASRSAFARYEPAFEETLEMAGTTLLLTGLLHFAFEQSRGRQKERVMAAEPAAKG